MELILDYMGFLSPQLVVLASWSSYLVVLATEFWLFVLRQIKRGIMIAFIMWNCDIFPYLGSIVQFELFLLNEEHIIVLAMLW